MNLMSSKYVAKLRHPKTIHYSNLSPDFEPSQLAPFLCNEQFLGDLILTGAPKLQFALPSNQLKGLTSVVKASSNHQKVNQ